GHGGSRCCTKQLARSCRRFRRGSRAAVYRSGRRISAVSPRAKPLGSIPEFSPDGAARIVCNSTFSRERAMPLHSGTPARSPRPPAPSARPPTVHPLLGSLEMMGARMTFSRNCEIYGDDEPADYLYKVVRGAVRICKLLDDGRRQVTAFHLPGDVFGLEVTDTHRFTAEAITD